MERASRSVTMAKDGRQTRPSRRELILAACWYAVLAGLVLTPWHRAGYLLFLDWAPTPEIRWRVAGALGIHDAPVLAILVGLGKILPSWVVQRIILLGAVWGAGFTAHVTAPVGSLIPRLFAGMLYAISPFVFVRVLAGHWRLLVAYALAPLAVRAIVRLAREPSRRFAVAAGLWVAGIAAISAHALLLGAVLTISALVALGVGTRPGRVASGFLVAAGVIVAGTGWWVVPAALHGVPARAGVETLDVFASTAVGASPLPVTLLGLRGFWVERLNPTAPAGWPFLAVGLVALAFLGMAVAVRNGRRVAALTMIAASIVAFVMALGVATPVSEPLLRPLYRMIPGLAIFREPQKGLVLLVLTYAWFGAVGIEWLRTRSTTLIRGAAIVLLALPAAFTPQVFGGLGGRLRPVEYPASWGRAERLLANDSDRFSVLSLPWQLYFPLPFGDPDKPLANPIPEYFSIPVIASDDPQIVPGREGSLDPVSRRIEDLLASHRSIDRFGAGVAPLNVKYVLLVPRTHPGAYGFLFRQRDLVVVLSSPQLVVFRNSAWRRLG